MTQESLNEFRNYLTVLARAQMGGVVKRKMNVSDIVQNTLLEAHKAADDFRGTTGEQQAAWLRKILARQIILANRHFHFEKLIV